MRVGRFGKYQVSLSKQPAPAKRDGQEQGSSGAYATNYFTSESWLGSRNNPSINSIMKMIDEDGTAGMLYAAYVFPVLATSWRLDADPLDVVTASDGTETHPQADFALKALTNPQHKGGMSTPFSLVMADITLAVAQGYRIFEIVYKLNDEGYIVFQKVVAREADQVKILTDDTGGLAGMEQSYVNDKGKSITVAIELPYTFLYTFNKHRDKLKGKTAFRAAYYHYDKKHRLYYLADQQAQVGATGLKVLQQPDGAKDPDISSNLAAVDRMAVRPTISLPFGWKLDIKDMTKQVDLMPYINHHDVSMARSTLMQGLLQGNTGKDSGGSYNLVAEHMDFMMLQEQTFMATIEEHITAFLVSKLIDYNFATPLYPTFKFNDMTDEVNNLLREAFKGLITKGGIPEWVAAGISEKVAEQMEIVKPEGADDADTTDDTSGTDNSGGSNGGGDSTVENSKSKKKETKLAKAQWWRELTATESKVNFSAIESKANTEESDLVKDLRPAFKKIFDDATKRLEPILSSDNPANGMADFSLKYDAGAQTVMATHMLNTYSDAKNKAADEIKAKAPANKKTSKDLINQHCQSIVDKQLSDLAFNTRTMVTDAIRKNLLDRTELSVADIIAKIAAMYSEFFDDKEPLTASSLITTAINIGRDDVFMDNKSKIYGYQYSAILDEKVCPVCEDLDGSVVDQATYNATIWMPPIHFNCRCIWVAIMNDEVDPPEFKPIPDAPGGTTAPSLSKHTDENGLSAATDYQLYLNQEAENLWRKVRS